MAEQNFDSRVLSPPNAIPKKLAALFPTALLFHGLSLVLALVLLAPPPFERIFADLGAQLPILTKMLLNLSRWFHGRLAPDQILPGVYGLAPVMLAAAGAILMRKLEARQHANDRPLSRLPELLIAGIVGFELTALAVVFFVIPSAFVWGVCLFAALLPVSFFYALVWLKISGRIDDATVVDSRATPWILITIFPAVGLILVALTLLFVRINTSLT